MKFDCIIMNPPYDRSLHLKILAEAIKHLKDDESKVVNLSPVRWLQDPLAKYKKNSDYHRFEESVSKHIESLDFFSKFDMTSFFHQCNCDAGIYTCNAFTENDFDYRNFKSNDLLTKFISLDADKMSKVVEFDKLNGYRVRCGKFTSANTGATTRANSDSVKLGKFEYVHFKLLRIYKDGYSVENGKFWTEDKMPGAGNKSRPIGTPIPTSVFFKSEAEARNFVKSTKTSLIRTLHWLCEDVNTNYDEILPWMGNSLNPRTGKLGYESEWTDEDFRKFFGITDEEWNTIETTMEKFK